MCYDEARQMCKTHAVTILNSFLVGEITWFSQCTDPNDISRVSDQNGVSQLHIIVEMHHFGWEPLIWKWEAKTFSDAHNIIKSSKICAWIIFVLTVPSSGMGLQQRREGVHAYKSCHPSKIQHQKSRSIHIHRSCRSNFKWANIWDPPVLAVNV